MATVADVLAKKGTAVYSVGTEINVVDAIRVMAEKSAGTVLVMEGDKMLGILSERDFMRKVVLANGDPVRMQVKDIMTRNVIFVKPDTTIEDCMELMTIEKIRHLPVLKEHKVVGILSIGDLVKYMVNEKDELIKHYEKYIYEGY